MREEHLSHLTSTNAPAYDKEALSVAAAGRLPSLTLAPSNKTI